MNTLPSLSPGPPSLRNSLIEEDVISLRTAGDISLARGPPDTVPLLSSPTGSYYYYCYPQTEKEGTYKEPYSEKKKKGKKKKAQQQDEYQEPFGAGVGGGRGGTSYPHHPPAYSQPVYDNLKSSHPPHTHQQFTVTGGGSMRANAGGRALLPPPVCCLPHCLLTSQEESPAPAWPHLSAVLHAAPPCGRSGVHLS